MSPQEMTALCNRAEALGLRADRLALAYSDAAFDAVTEKKGTAFQGFALALDLLGLPVPARFTPRNKRRAITALKIAAAVRNQTPSKDHNNA